jgi:hypothetical protein
VVGEVEVVERENKNGEAFKVVNFSIVSKDDEGNKHYTNCSAYGEKGDIPKDFKQGDFVKIFGQERKSIDDNGKEHKNVRIFASKLLKAKEQIRARKKRKSLSLEQLRSLRRKKNQSLLKRKKLPKKRKDNELSVGSSDCTDYFFCRIKYSFMI